MNRPTKDDCDPYFLRYSDRVPEGDVVETLRRQGAETAALLTEIDEERAEHRYEPGKWSIKELWAHVVDTERIFSYRAMWLARGEKQGLPGFDADELAAGADLSNRSFASVLTEFRTLREANLALFESLDEEAWNRQGTVSDHPMRAAAVPWILAGHELHHVEVLRERYL